MMHNLTLTSALLTAAVLTVSAAQSRRNTHEEVADVMNGLKNIYSLAGYEVSGIAMSNFEPVCKVLGQLNMIEVQLQNETEAQEHNESLSIDDTVILQSILAVAEGMKNSTCAWVNSELGNTLSDGEENSCSMHKLELFCKRAEIYSVSRGAHNTLQESYSGVPGRSCEWLLRQQLDTHPLFDTIKSIVLC